MHVFAKFDEIPSMILQEIKETKRYGQTVGRSDGHSDNVKTVYPPTNTVCGGYKKLNCENTVTIGQDGEVMAECGIIYRYWLQFSLKNLIILRTHNI